MTVELIVDGLEMAAILRGPDGPVMRMLEVRATRLQLAARAQLDATTHGSGKLSSQIVKRPGMEGDNPVIKVGAFNSEIALFVHDGTKPHDIYPRNKQALAFFSKTAGPARVVKTGRGKNASRAVNVVVKHVHHPGTKPNRFLADNLHLAVEP